MKYLGKIRLLNLISAKASALMGIAVFASINSDAQAAQVNWGSERLATNLTSAGAGSPMDASFTFELGAFDPGFIPTAANRNEWISRWHGAASANYSETYDFFTGSVLVDPANPAFSASNQGYIWGFNSRTPGQTVEWVLITSPAWLWPNASGIATPLEWCVAEASVAVVGQINAPDGSCHMRSASLSLGESPSDPIAWRDTTFGSSASNDAVAGWDADPDGDGSSNLLEFALGTEALRGNGGAAVTPGTTEIGGSVYQTLSVARVRRPAIDYVPEVSSDLSQWSSGTEFVEVIEDSESRLTVRDRTPRTGNRRFMRLSVRLVAVP